MSKKKPVYVSIPVGHACLSLDCLFQMNMEAERLRFENTENLRDITRLQGQITKTTEQLAEAEKKIEELEKELNKKQDSIMYWFNKYQSLCNELEKVKSNAEAKTT